MKNQNLINKLLNRTSELCNLLKMQAAQEEIYFLPMGILLMKWINDSKQRFNWYVPNELRNLFTHSEYTRTMYSFEDGSKNIYRMAEELEKNNPILKGIFTSLCFSYIDFVSIEHLENILKAYSEFQFTDDNSEKDITGPFIESFLYKLSNDSRFYEFMNIADIVCGTGGILSEVVNEYQNNININ